MSATVERKPFLGGDPLDRDGLNFNSKTSDITTAKLPPPSIDQNTISTTSAPVKGLDASALPFVPGASITTAKAPQLTSKIEGLKEERLDAAAIIKSPPPMRAVISGQRLNTTGQAATQAIADVRAHAQAEANRRNLPNPDSAATINQVIRNDGLRTGFAMAANAQHSGDIVTNFLTLNTPQQLYVYNVDMVRSINANQTVLVSKRADAMQIMILVTQYVPQLQQLAGQWVTDGDLIWSTAALFNVQVQGNNPVVRLLPSQATPLTYRNECGTQLNLQEVRIFFHRLIPITGRTIGALMHDPAAANVRASSPDILIRGLNAFLTEHARGANQPFTFTNAKKGYEHPPPFVPGQHRPLQLERNSIGRDLIRALNGFFLSARPGIDRLLVNVNSICTPFFGDQNLHVFLSSGTIAHMSPRQKSNIMKGVLVRITFPVQNGWQPPSTALRFIRRIDDGGNMSCHADAHGHGVQVHTCFANNSHAHRTIRPSNNPQVNPASMAVEVATNMLTGNAAPALEWYPADVLEIVGHQPYHASLSTAAVSRMVPFARANPLASYNKIMNRGLAMFGLNAAGQNGLANFGGMSTGQQMLEIPGHWLAPPTIQYDAPRTPNSASWNLAGVRFVQNATNVQQLRFMNVNPGNAGGPFASRHPAFQAKRRTIANALRAHGILGNANQAWITNAMPANNNPASPFNIDLTQPAPTPQFEQSIATKLRDIRPQIHALSPVLVALNSKSIPMYSYIKRVGDLRFGINTIIIDQSGSNFNAQKGSNIALKYNLKIGQATHTLAANAFGALRTPARMRDTIVIGADVTHPGKGAIPGTPSIAAVVGNTDDNFVHFPGSMRLQRNRKEFIIELGDMVKERLIDWAERHGDRLPKNMLFYRDGVSESQHAKLRSYEIPQIEQAFKWAQEFLTFRASGGAHNHQLDPTRDPWPPVANPSQPGTDHPNGVDDLFADPANINTDFKLTYVVVGKRHNTRFYPKDSANVAESIPNNGNVKPGLVVDQVITHPLSFDFYLQSHKPIAGTGRSAHYIVMQNNMDFTAAELHAVVSL